MGPINLRGLYGAWESVPLGRRGPDLLRLTLNSRFRHRIVLRRCYFLPVELQLANWHRWQKYWKHSKAYTLNVTETIQSGSGSTLACLTTFLIHLLISETRAAFLFTHSTASACAATVLIGNFDSTWSLLPLPVCVSVSLRERVSTWRCARLSGGGTKKHIDCQEYARVEWGASRINSCCPCCAEATHGEEVRI